MKKIQILGTGCSKCNKLTELAKLAADQAAIEYELTKVTDIKEIMKFGVMSTPALVIDGQVKSSGVVPSVEQIKNYLSERR